MKNRLNFNEAVEYVRSLDVYGSVLGLDNMRALASELDNPQDGLKFIHVTGTNGKGSVCAFITSVLATAGYKVGAYNSPAVLSDTDQFRINTKIVSKSLYAEAITLVKSAADKVVEASGVYPTRFEVETMAAFVMFYIEKCDIVVLETGLGGRDDATNIINTSILHVITSISKDHTAVLGSTLEEIVKNKCGIIKTSAPVVFFDNEDSEFLDESAKARQVVINKCAGTGSDLILVNGSHIESATVSRGKLNIIFRGDAVKAVKRVKVSMTGAYQKNNVLIAIRVIETLIEMGYNITAEAISIGMEKAKIPFRFEKIKYNNLVDIILDGAHNPDGAKNFIDSLRLNYKDKDFIFIIGIFKDKDYEKIAKITGEIARKIYVIENTKSPRALDRNTLCKVYSKYCRDVYARDSIEEAICSAIKNVSDRNTVICCFGSLSWLADAKTVIKELR